VEAAKLRAGSFDYLVGESEERWRDFEAERLGGLQWRSLGEAALE
jgi:hypothetical protein